MDHYYKGENEEESLSRDRVPIVGLPESYGWLEVSGATRVKSVVGSLCKTLRQEKALVLSGAGPHTSKVVSLAEIIKRKHKQVVMLVQPGEMEVKEFWQPKVEEEGLDTLVVTRRLPTLHVLLNLSRDNAHTKQDLYDAVWAGKTANNTHNNRQRTQRTKSRVESKEMA